MPESLKSQNQGCKARLYSLACLLLSGLCLAQSGFSQAIPLEQQTWSAEVIRPHGQPVIPLFDGWFANSDGSNTLCYGYFNLNTDESFQIPAGELNYLTGPEDLDSALEQALLPTHFDPLPPRYRRKFCVFTVRVPADFGRDETVVWTLTSNGQTLTVPGHTLPAYVLDEPASDGRGDVAPQVRLTSTSAPVRGRVGVSTDEAIQARVGEPVSLRAWIEHPSPRVWVGWSQHTGPGTVLFDIPEAEVSIKNGPAMVAARFDQPGDYVIRLQTIDDTAAFEFYCCHTNAYYYVSVSD